jgi:hypothetical protein
MKQTFLLLVGLLWWLSLCAQHDRDNLSLRAALQTEGIPAHYAFENDLDLRISSGTVVDTPLGRIFAYYANPRNAESLSKTFYLFRKLKSGWIGGKMQWPEPSENGSFECEGGSISVSAQGSYLIVDGHLTPSAGCLLVLNAQLKPLRSFYGISARFVGSRSLLITGSNVHFAPTHPLKLWILDAENGNKELVYPLANESAGRSQFRAQLGKLQEKCEEDASTQPGCRQRWLDADLNFDGAILSEDNVGFFVAPELGAFLVEVKVEDYAERQFYYAEATQKTKPNPRSVCTTGSHWLLTNNGECDDSRSDAGKIDALWKTPNFFVIYRIVPERAAQAPNKWQSKAIDREEFVARFGVLATARAPDAAMLDALWKVRL